jgi:pimeloyl-ACP methyl ester carboxylesterase
MMIWHSFPVTLLVLAAAVAHPAGMLRGQDEPESERFTVTVDEATGVSTITLPAENGRVAWSDVIRALARSGRLDDAALQALPSGQLDLGDPRGRLGLIALNLVLPPEITVTVLRSDADTGAEPALQITIDEPGLESRVRSIQKRIRERAADDAGTEYGLTLDEDWERFPSDQAVVVLIHGYNSTPDSLDALHKAVHEAGHPVAVFAYPNDGPLDESAALLCVELREFAANHPERRLDIVAHSMGGLVARAVIEDPELNPGNVRRLIMVATPNQGSQLACFPGGLDCVEHLATRSADGLPGLFRDAAADGFNESCHDMRPASRFLKQLNARERNADVRYSLLIGTDGPLTPESLAELQSVLDRAAAENPVAGLLAPRYGPPDDLDEVLEDAGDGAVAVKRARLEGVTDTVLLAFSHLTITRGSETENGRVLLDAILTRLE